MPQLTPVPVTVPVPTTVTLSARFCGLNFAFALRAAVIASVQLGDVPVQSPSHFSKEWPVPGAAVSVTDVPSTYFSAQSVPQAMPAGELDTLPPAVFFTVRVYSFLQTPPSAR